MSTPSKMRQKAQIHLKTLNRIQGKDRFPYFVHRLTNNVSVRVFGNHDHFGLGQCLARLISGCCALMEAAHPGLLGLGNCTSRDTQNLNADFFLICSTEPRHATPRRRRRIVSRKFASHYFVILLPNEQLCFWNWRLLGHHQEPNSARACDPACVFTKPLKVVFGRLRGRGTRTGSTREREVENRTPKPLTTDDDKGLKKLK